MLLVEQNTRFAERVGERHYIISNGEIVYTGDQERFIMDEAVKERYLGV
jgi:branched-chain amino acid transport system ATP-binding protein